MACMPTERLSLPVVRDLPPALRPADLFDRLAGIPGCLWFDSAPPVPVPGSPISAPRSPISAPGSTFIASGLSSFAPGSDVTPDSLDADHAGLATGLGRYSFLTADPIAWLAARPGDPDPWPQLIAWQRDLPDSCLPGLPPFQGGMAGLLGYEAATWLEPISPARVDDLPTAAVAFGIYDWTIAWDHRLGRGWIISQGLGASDPAERYRRAISRLDQVSLWIENGIDRAVSETVMLERRSRAPGESQALEPPSLEPPSVSTRSGMATQFETPHTGVTSNFGGAGYRAAVGDIIGRIRRGDSFQVNLAQRLLRPAADSPVGLYRRLRVANPAPFAAYFDAGDFQVLSSSPERFLRVRGRQVETRPIKGTVPRTGDPTGDARLANELRQSQKDRAENVMIVDLMRNDLSRVCQDASVRVTQLCEVEAYRHVQHLVSAVEGRLADGMGPVELLRVCFPGGSVTGAPKVEAMRTIAELEPTARGPYCGSLGYISCGGAADFNILIRTITAAGGYWQIPVGGGITARSLPEREEEETWVKAQGMLQATDYATVSRSV